MEKVFRRIAAPESAKAEVDDPIYRVDDDASVDDITLPSLGDNAKEE
jgi:hypothetical protein